MNTERIEQLVHDLLIELGEDPSREGLAKTPHRVAEAFKFLTKGYHQSVDDAIRGAVFESEANNMIIVRDRSCANGYLSRPSRGNVSREATAY